MDQVKRLQQLMARLRSKKGCPWDKKQTHHTLKPYLIEEAHEVLDAIDSKNPGDLREELGDLLLQVIFHSQLAGEKKRFNFNDVAETISAGRPAQVAPRSFAGSTHAGQGFPAWIFTPIRPGNVQTH